MWNWMEMNLSAQKWDLGTKSEVTYAKKSCLMLQIYIKPTCHPVDVLDFKTHVCWGWWKLKAIWKLSSWGFVSAAIGFPWCCVLFCHLSYQGEYYIVGSKLLYSFDFSLIWLFPTWVLSKLSEIRFFDIERGENSGHFLKCSAYILFIFFSSTGWDCMASFAKQLSSSHLIQVPLT